MILQTVVCVKLFITFNRELSLPMLSFVGFPWCLAILQHCFSLCLHDAVQKETQVVSPPEAFTHTRRIVSRATTWAPHLPLRVTPCYLPGKSALLTPPQISQLQTAMNEVTKTISSMLSGETPTITQL